MTVLLSAGPTGSSSDPLTFPHCEPLVLHAPGVCDYCDRYPKRQAARIRSKTLFTGEVPRDGWTACPADLRRPPSSGSWHGNWYGNVPAPAGRLEEWQRRQREDVARSLLSVIRELAA